MKLKIHSVYPQLIERTNKDGEKTVSCIYRTSIPKEIIPEKLRREVTENKDGVLVKRENDKKVFIQFLDLEQNLILVRFKSGTKKDEILNGGKEIKEIENLLNSNLEFIKDYTTDMGRLKNLNGKGVKIIPLDRKVFKRKATFNLLEVIKKLRSSKQSEIVEIKERFQLSEEEINEIREAVRNDDKFKKGFKILDKLFLKMMENQTIKKKIRDLLSDEEIKKIIKLDKEL